MKTLVEEVGVAMVELNRTLGLVVQATGNFEPEVKRLVDEMLRLSAMVGGRVEHYTPDAAKLELLPMPEAAGGKPGDAKARLKALCKQLSIRERKLMELVRKHAPSLAAESVEKLTDNQAAAIVAAWEKIAPMLGREAK